MSLAAVAFAAVYLVPFGKCPANPRAIGQADTIESRTLGYLVSVVAAIAALWPASRLVSRLGSWTAGLSAAGAFRQLCGPVLTGCSRRRTLLICPTCTRYCRHAKCPPTSDSHRCRS
ncbi:hypothetical protein BST45_15460 [Mycobacterium shinjukuense]|nr:hypothetical protein BST45_15460 [Mycobacterium shinjukuense]